MKVKIKNQLIETEEIQFTETNIQSSTDIRLHIYFKNGETKILKFDNKKDLDEALNKLQNPTKQLLQG